MKDLLNLFFPPICLGCKNVISYDDKSICIKCRHKLPLTTHHLQLENEFYKRMYGRLHLQQACSMFYFHKKGITQELLHQLKYKNQPQIGTELAHWYAATIHKNNLFQDVSCVIPVPIHKLKLKNRGYNQVESFAKTIAEHLQVPYIDTVLVRKSNIKTQVFKNLINRIEVTDNVFAINEEFRPEGMHFLLIDDLITTGSTLESCGKLLLKMPNAKLSILTMGFAH